MTAGSVGHLQLRLLNVRLMRQRHPNLWWTLVAALAYTVTAIAVTYPLVFNLSSGLAGRGDSLEYNWALWRVKQVISGSGGGLAYLPWLNHPAGLYHPFMLTMLTVDLTALPFLLVFPSHVVYNLHILTGLVLCSLSAYWFIGELTGDRHAGLLGGIVFGFCSNRMGHVIAAHLPQTLAYWVPVFGLLLWRVVWEPSWRRGLLCGLVLVPALLVHAIHVVYFILPLTLAILFYALVELRARFFDWKRLVSLTLAFGLAAIVAVPSWRPSILAQRQEGYLSARGTVGYSTDLLAFLAPSSEHPILEPIDALPKYASEVFSLESLAYPGVLTTLLAVWGLSRCWRHTWIWGALAVLCLMLSLGPILKMGGQPVSLTLDKQSIHVALPYALIDSLPLVGVSRTPGRINETTFFALAVLVGFGFSTLHRHLTRGWLSSIVVGILAVGILFEMLVRWPFPLANAEVPGVVQAIAAEDDTGALLHVPPFSEAIQKNIALHYQTVHERPIVGGWIHRPLPEAEPWEATFFRLVRTDRAGEDIVASPDLAQRRAWLHHLDIDYVIVQKVKMADAKANKYRLLIEELLGPTAMEDEALAAFQVPPRAPDPADAVLYSFSEDGWNNPEQDGGIWRRWMYNDGRLYIYSIREETGCLQFTVDSHLDFPLLEVYQGEELLDTFVAGDRTTHATQPITLTKGMNVIRFHAPGGCPEVLDDPRCWSEALLAPPEHDPTLPCDARATCRTFVFDHVAFVPADELAIGQSMNVNFGNQMRLRGWALDERTLHPGGVLTATLTWEAAVELSDRYVVFAHLLSSDGELVAQYDDAPVGKALPRDAWPPGATFKYPLAVELPGDLSAGEYRLYVGVYLWPDVERLLVLSDVPGAENDAVELSGVEIAP